MSFDVRAERTFSLLKYQALVVQFQYSESAVPAQFWLTQTWLQDWSLLSILFNSVYIYRKKKYIKVHDIFVSALLNVK